jgi:hypothetical protein
MTLSFNNIKASKMNATTQTENPQNRKPHRNGKYFLSIKQQTRENLGGKEKRARTHTHIIHIVHIYKHGDTYTHNSSSILITLTHETQVPLPPLSAPGREHNTKEQKTKNRRSNTWLEEEEEEGH